MDEKEINSIIATNITKQLELHNKTQLELAEYMGVSQATVSNWCKGVKMPRMTKIDMICKFFSISRSELMNEPSASTLVLSNIKNIFPIEKKTFPMLGEIACGIPKYASEERESYIKAGTDIDADFCLKASGDSMIGARIKDGDIVFIRKQEIVDNGDIAAVIVNDNSEATLKRLFYYQEKALLILRAENPKYEDLIFTKEELNEVHVLGKAVAFQSDVE